jgi:outer membrane protein assembly factor BamB
MTGGILVAATRQNAPAKPSAAVELAFERHWNHTISAAGQLAIAAGPKHVFVSDDETGIEARAVGDGKTAWQADLPTDLPAAIAGDQVYVASASQIHALDEGTGQKRWARPLGGQAVALVAHNTGALTAAGRTVRAWSADGNRAWEHDLDATIVRDLLAVDATQVYVGLTNHTLVALDLASGAVKWTKQLGTVPIAFAIAGGRLFFGGTDRNLHAYSRNGGHDWTFRREDVVGAPAADGEYVYAALSDNTIVAHDHGGGQKWRRPLANRPARGPMLSERQVISILQSDQIVVMPKVADRPGAAPAAAPPDPAAKGNEAAQDLPRNQVKVAAASVDGAQIFAVIQLENGVRAVVAYKRKGT